MHSLRELMQRNCSYLFILQLCNCIYFHKDRWKKGQHSSSSVRTPFCARLRIQTANPCIKTCHVSPVLSAILWTCAVWRKQPQSRVNDGRAARSLMISGAKINYCDNRLVAKWQISRSTTVRQSIVSRAQGAIYGCSPNPTFVFSGCFAAQDWCSLLEQSHYHGCVTFVLASWSVLSSLASLQLRRAWDSVVCLVSANTYTSSV